MAGVARTSSGSRRARSPPPPPPPPPPVPVPRAPPVPAASCASSTHTLSSAPDVSEDLWSEDGHDPDDDDDAWDLSPASAYTPVPPLARPERCPLDIHPPAPAHLPPLGPANSQLRFKPSTSADMAVFSDSDSEFALSDDDGLGPCGPRYTHQRRLQTLRALYVQTNQALSEPAWRAAAPCREDTLFAQAVPVFAVASLTEAQFAAVRARLEQDDDGDDGCSDREEKSFVYIHAPFPLPLTGRPDAASVAGGWPPALREHMVQSVVGLRERLLRPECVPMAVMLDPDTPRDGFVTLLYLADEGDPAVPPEAARLASLGISRGLDALVREGVRVRAEEAWVALTTAELNLTMDEAVEPHAQEVAPWRAPFGTQDIHQHLP